MFAVPNQDSEIAVALVPKCANTSIRTAFGIKGRTISCDEAIEKKTRLFFMRQPLDRLQSAYRYFHWVYDSGGNYQTNNEVKLSKEILESWESFVDYILLNKDPHWQPQTEWVRTTDGVFVPTNIYKLDDISEVWGQYFKGLIPKENETVKYPIDTSYRLGDVADYYTEDYKVWHGVM